MQKIGLVFICVSAIWGTSCSSELEEVQSEASMTRSLELSKDDNSTLKNYSWTFTYKGEEYSYEVMDGKMTCDERTYKIVDLLSANPNLVTFMDANDKVVYYDTRADYELAENSDKQLLEYPYGEIKSINLSLFEDKKYRGHVLVYDREGSDANLHVKGWGDRISSVKLDITGEENHAPLPKIRVEATFYEDIQFGGHQLVFTAYLDMAAHKRDLRDIPLGPGVSGNWGDRISSLKINK